MAVEYVLIIKSQAGIVRRILTGQEGGFRQLSYKKMLNDVGVLMFDLASNHAAIADLERYGQVEVWRRDIANSLDWYADFETLYMDEMRSADDDGNSVFQATCCGNLQLLADARVLWPANVASRSLFSAAKAETIMKTLVTYNAVAASATTANGRIRTTDQSHITVAADGAGGNTITFACAQDNLLEALQNIARIGDRDFWLARTAAQTWQFNTAQYFGTDRSATVTFALNYGNMSSPVLRRSRLSEKTVVVVGGQGTDSSRVFEVRTSSTYNATNNSREDFYPATEYTTVAGLDAAGDVRLDELRAKDDLTWSVIQTPGCSYGIHYFLGDLVTGFYQDITATKQISEVSVTFAPGDERAETIQIGTINL